MKLHFFQITCLCLSATCLWQSTTRCGICPLPRTDSISLFYFLSWGLLISVDVSASVKITTSGNSILSLSLYLCLFLYLSFYLSSLSLSVSVSLFLFLSLSIFRSLFHSFSPPPSLSFSPSSLSLSLSFSLSLSLSLCLLYCVKKIITQVSGIPSFPFYRNLPNSRSGTRNVWGEASRHTPQISLQWDIRRCAGALQLHPWEDDQRQWLSPLWRRDKDTSRR